MDAKYDHPFHHRGHQRSRLDAPTRTRTRDSSLGPRCDGPLHHQGARAEGKGFEPSFHKRETALAVRPGQPYPATFRFADTIPQWTTGESNPDFLVASQASFRWTSSPFLIESSRRESNPRFLFVREVSSPLDHGTQRPSTGPPACPRPRYRAGQVGLMRADRAPATPGFSG
jgi:hypothetical protein